ncbi:TIGR00270 family protein [archaeon]|nr:MAG: TIGR00270 family protein [archaeon]
MFCNLCGRDYARLNKAEVEGAVVDACDKCARFGKISSPSQKQVSVGFASMEVEIAANYGEIIKKYRESKQLTQEEFASRLSEKVSIIKRLEEETMEPDDKLVKKVEGLLGLKLVDEGYSKKLGRQ